MANDSDLVQRLRSVDISWNEAGEYCAEAAERIDALNAMLAMAVEALGNIAIRGNYADMQIARAALIKLSLQKEV